MDRAELKNPGGKKVLGSVAAVMLLSVPPLAKPLTNAAFAAAAWLKTFPGVPGASVPGPTKNWLYTGGLFRKLSATVAGKKSWKIPIPPRSTVLVPAPRGVHAKPRRGSQPMVVYDGSARCNPVRIA